jgi:hypothetical protein
MLKDNKILTDIDKEIKEMTEANLNDISKTKNFKEIK